MRELVTECILLAAAPRKRSYVMELGNKVLVREHTRAWEDNINMHLKIITQSV
jgi:hypothetical protein